MIGIAIMGFGIVGCGVADLLKLNAENISKKAGEEIRLIKILDIRDFPDSPYADLFVKNAEEIFQDDRIQIVIETIGGAKVANELTRRAICSGKHVVTSNKELVATFGPEIMNLAFENHVHYLFEASVGGGIPVIMPLNQCLAANEIVSITGILNGTTNYILTSMSQLGLDFTDAISQAQQKGYAEADPSADIQGLDTVRKLAILSSIAFDEYVDYKKIVVSGIDEITQEDLHAASRLGYRVKLIARAQKVDLSYYAWVGVAFVPEGNILAHVEDVNNAIMIHGNATQDVMFYGRGAGKLPTASAVIADVIDIVKSSSNEPKHLWKVPAQHHFTKHAPEEISGYYLEASKSIRFYVRLRILANSSEKVDFNELRQTIISSFQEEVDFQYEDHPNEKKDEIQGFIYAPSSNHLNLLLGRLVSKKQIRPDFRMIRVLEKN